MWKNAVWTPKFTHNRGFNWFQSLWTRLSNRGSLECWAVYLFGIQIHWPVGPPEARARLHRLARRFYWNPLQCDGCQTQTVISVEPSVCEAYFVCEFFGPHWIIHSASYIVTYVVSPGSHNLAESPWTWCLSVLYSCLRSTKTLCPRHQYINQSGKKRALRKRARAIGFRCTDPCTGPCKSSGAFCDILYLKQSKHQSITPTKAYCLIKSGSFKWTELV